MPPTPISASGVIRLSIEIVSLTHNIDFYCELEPSTGYAAVKRNLPLVGYDTVDVPAQRLWDKIRAVYPSSVLAAQATLFHKVGNALIPTASAVLTGTGSGSGSVQLATQLTLTLRDIDQHLMRVQLPETVYAVPFKDTIASTAAPLQAIVDDLTATPDGTVAGSWINTRAGEQPTRGLYASGDTNDKYRRARGL